jgi:DNA processing protein
MQAATMDILRLTLLPGLGPILLRRAVETLGSPQAVLNASEAELRRVKGIGPDRVRAILPALGPSLQRAERELDRATALKASLLAYNDPGYPELLRSLPDAPPLLFVRGELDPARDRYPLGIVGSRKCTHYGIEQTERFSLALASSGITIVSGGALGIDTAAHRAALRARGRTVAVLGCGLANCYPPENRELFDQIVGAGGAVVSELPLDTPPAADNFPARNRIISGLSLGVLVIEAGLRSGALITARIAAEDHAREVFALPSRVDSSAALGSLELLKSGGAQLVTHPDDILQALESPARHLHNAAHADRFAALASMEDPGDHSSTDGPLFASASPAAPPPTRATPRDAGLSAQQTRILESLDSPQTVDELSSKLGLAPAALRADITVLEIKRRLSRHGSKFARIAQ